MSWKKSCNDRATVLSMNPRKRPPPRARAPIPPFHICGRVCPPPGSSLGSQPSRTRPGLCPWAVPVWPGPATWHCPAGWWTRASRGQALAPPGWNWRVNLEWCWSLFGLVGFLTPSSTTRLYRRRVPRLTSDKFYVLPHMRQSWETMTSVSAGYIILTPTQPVGSGRPQRESNRGPPHQEFERSSILRCESRCVGENKPKCVHDTLVYFYLVDIPSPKFQWSLYRLITLWLALRRVLDESMWRPSHVRAYRPFYHFLGEALKVLHWDLKMPYFK